MREVCGVTFSGYLNHQLIGKKRYNKKCFKYLRQLQFLLGNMT